MDKNYGQAISQRQSLKDHKNIFGFGSNQENGIKTQQGAVLDPLDITM